MGQVEEWRKAHGLNHDMLNLKNEKDIILPQQVIQSLYQTTKGDAYVTSDVGQHQMFAAQYYKFKEPRKWINSGGLGTMGFGLPSAMGVKFAFPEADVACVTGEGSIQMCIQELSTCGQYGLPIKIINLNNRALGMVKQWQDMQYGGRYSSISYEDSLPDFVKLAESFGHVGIKVEKLSELNDAMKESFAMKDKLVFLDVLVDPDEHVYPMLEAGGSMSEMRLSKDKKTFKMASQISLLMENQPGALSRVIGLFSQRGYNIDSLSVAPTQDPTLSRLTMTTSESLEIIQQILKQLYKLIDVVMVQDLKASESISLEMALIKVSNKSEVISKIEKNYSSLELNELDNKDEKTILRLIGETDNLETFS